MFAAGEVSLENGMKFTCETNYPYDFEILYQIEKGGNLALRIPGFSKTWQIDLNGRKLSQTDVTPKKGYVYLSVSDGDTVRLTLDGTPRFQYASSKVPELTGKTAVCRGPLVYCFEGVDNQDDILSLSLRKGGALNISDGQSALPEGTVTITADALRTQTTDDADLYTDKAPFTNPCQAVAVPYYTWGNRGENQMRVWMDYQ